jgi:large conductance mechanosensitive channel
VLVKEVNRLYRAKPVEPAAPPREEILLTEIRDLLKQSAR